MIDVLERHIKSCELQLAESSRRDLQATRKGDAEHWWPFGGTGTETKDMTKDQHSPTAVESDGPSKSWWPFSKKRTKLESADAPHHEKMKRVGYSSSDRDTGNDG
jgi:hypothetical protein